MSKRLMNLERVRNRGTRLIKKIKSFNLEVNEVQSDKQKIDIVCK